MKLCRPDTTSQPSLQKQTTDQDYWYVAGKFLSFLQKHNAFWGWILAIGLHLHLKSIKLRNTGMLCPTQKKGRSYCESWRLVSQSAVSYCASVPSQPNSVLFAHRYPHELLCVMGTPSIIMLWSRYTLWIPLYILSVATEGDTIFFPNKLQKWQFKNNNSRKNF